MGYQYLGDWVVCCCCCMQAVWMSLQWLLVDLHMPNMCICLSTKDIWLIHVSEQANYPVTKMAWKPCSWSHLVLTNIYLASNIVRESTWNISVWIFGFYRNYLSISLKDNDYLNSKLPMHLTGSIYVAHRYVFGKACFMRYLLLTEIMELGEDPLLDQQQYKYMTVDDMKSLGDDSMRLDVTNDEKSDYRNSMGKLNWPIS